MSKANEQAPKAEFNDLQDGGGDAAARDVNLEVILDVPVTLSMEVGRTRIPIYGDTTVSTAMVGDFAVAFLYGPAGAAIVSSY